MTDADEKPRCFGCALDRRGFVRLAGYSTGLMFVGATVNGCGNQMGSPPTGPVSGGNLSSLSVGTLVVRSNVVVGRDANGVYAMSAVCTHEGCLLVDSAGTIAAGLDCPCHESTFDGGGMVTHGPARASLQHYLVTIAADGEITVDGSQPVAASARTAVA